MVAAAVNAESVLRRRVHNMARAGEQLLLVASGQRTGVVEQTSLRGDTQMSKFKGTNEFTSLR